MAMLFLFMSEYSGETSYLQVVDGLIEKYESGKWLIVDCKEISSSNEDVTRLLNVGIHIT